MNQKLKPMIYVACLAAYNAGQLHGQWLDAAREPAEIQEDIRAILSSSPVESGGDYAIHDYEGFGPISIHECHGIGQASATLPDCCRMLSGTPPRFLRRHSDMARVSRPDPGNHSRLRQALAEHFDGSPLAPIGQEVKLQLDAFDEVSDWSGFDQQSQREFFRQCNNLLHVIPAAARISGRFWFDISMIRAASHEWACSEPLLPGSILPRAASEWQYAGIHVPNFTPNRMPRIDVIDFPGGDDPEGIDLLTYPWLYHELGHLLLGLRGNVFLKTVAELLDQIIQRKVKQRLGKAPAVQERSQSLQDKVQKAWRPSPNHTDWSHEIATDIVALWSCGPAFLATLDDSLEGKKPHVIDEIHPPYEIRTVAIIEAAKRLGWENHTKSLGSRIDTWMETDWDDRDDVFMALSSQELVFGVVTAALDVCDALNLPRCDLTTLSEVENLLASGQLPPYGRSLILASWLTYEQCHENTTRYHEWERDTVDTLVREVTP